MDGVILMTSSVRQDGNNLFMMGLMRKISVYILGVLLVAVSCVNEQNFDVIPSAGDEVKFAAEMGESVATKTLYGADDPDAIMVKWVNGDKIKIFGTTCAVQEADYVVSVDGVNTPNVDDGKNIADGLTKTGEAGVQWGTADVSDFIAIYPSDKAEFKQNGTTVSVKSTIPSEQNYVFTPLEDNVPNRHWEGTNFSTDRNNPTMGDAIMYAYTSASKSDSTVPLAFNPLTTVLKFRFMGYEYGSELAEDETISVQSITVTAPEGYAISGDFNIDFSDAGEPSVYKAGNNTNSITLNTMLPDGLHLKMQKGDVVDFNVFTIPLEGYIGGSITRLENVEKKDAEGNTITDAEGKPIMVEKYTCDYPWTITIKTAGHGTFNYTTIPNHSGINELGEGQKLEVKPYALAPGEIHKIKVPQIVVEKDVVWDPKDWITKIPPPVYVSELSVPGAWYASDLENYQNSATLTALYNNGVRAFHIDCLMCPDDAEGNRLTGIEEKGPRKLICAGTQSASGLTLNYKQGRYVEDALNEIAGQIKSDEYVVVVLTIAEKPQTWTLDLGFVSQTLTIGSVDPDEVIPAITALIDSKGKGLNVFGYRDADIMKDEDGELLYENGKPVYKTLTKDTTVEDVLGSMIIKINTNTDELSSYTFPTSSLVSFASMAADTDYNNDDDNITNLPFNYFANYQTSPMIWGNDHTEANMLTYCYHQAQKTRIDDNNSATQQNPIPTLKDRKSAIDKIITISEELYKNSDHNIWFQMGIGGYNSANHQDKASVTAPLCDYLKEKIESKMKSNPSPVGIVLMNNCISNTDLINDIIEMNGKFYLNRRGNDVTTGGGTSAQELSTKAAAAYVGPDAF